MTEQERMEVEDTRNCGWESYTNQAVMKLIEIIERLDKQLANLVEIGEPIGRFVQHVSKKDDEHVLGTYALCPNGNWRTLTLGNIRRLEKALKEVNCD